MKKMIIAAAVLLAGAFNLAAEVRYIPASFKQLAEKVRPSVVNISTVSVIKQSADPFTDPFFKDDFYEKFFGIPKGQMTSRSLGSGFIVSPDGFILTNGHVVDKADEITVKLINQKEYKAKVVGTDKETDIAVIKIDVKGLSPILMGDSDSIEVGDWVVAVGSPFGLEQTVTQGIISAKGRIIGAGPYDDFLQTDAAINPGNSGGPLINMDGEVVGINTAISSTSGGYEGVGFALPINIAKKVYSDIISRGRVSRGWLGVVIQELSPELAKNFKVNEGVLISQVYQGSPAEKAGLQRGDVVIAIDGKQVKKYRQLQSMIAAAAVGKQVNITFIRSGKEMQAAVTVEERNLEKFAEQQRKKAAVDAEKDLGIIAGDITPEAAEQYGITAKQGVAVFSVAEGSAADAAGVMAGDVIHEMNGKMIKDKQGFEDALDRVKKGGQVVLLIERGNTMVYLAFTNQ